MNKSKTSRSRTVASGSGNEDPGGSKRRSGRQQNPRKRKRRQRHQGYRDAGSDRARDPEVAASIL